MSSIFVSAIPKSVPRHEVEHFLRSSFPTCVEVNVLRAAGGEETHKGHAYVHFGSESDASCAFTTYDTKTSTDSKKHNGQCNNLAHIEININNGNNEKISLTLNHTPLRLRLCSTGQTVKHKERKQENSSLEQELLKEHVEGATKSKNAMMQKELGLTHTLTHLEQVYLFPPPPPPPQHQYSTDNAQYVKVAYGPPLPPAFIHCYWRCCAYDYNCDSSIVYKSNSNKSIVNGGEEQNGDDDATNTDLPPFRYVVPLTKKHDNINEINTQTSTVSCAEADNTTTNNNSNNRSVGISLPCVVEFCTPEDCQRAVELAPDRFVRVGAPLLEELMQSPSSDSIACHSFTFNDQAKRMRKGNRHSSSHVDDEDDVEAKKRVKNEGDDNSETSVNIDATLYHWREKGFTLLTPIEALKELEQLFNGQGRVAVKDESGAIAILRVPTYVASID